VCNVTYTGSRRPSLGSQTPSIEGNDGTLPSPTAVAGGRVTSGRHRDRREGLLGTLPVRADFGRMVSTRSRAEADTFEVGGGSEVPDGRLLVRC